MHTGQSLFDIVHLFQVATHLCEAYIVQYICERLFQQIMHSVRQCSMLRITCFPQSGGYRLLERDMACPHFAAEIRPLLLAQEPVNHMRLVMSLGNISQASEHGAT